MGEIKSVKVDNWGVFFLQKLQNFFNKTDYCDLTLQFRDNSQLKVHRLVLSACTDYFNVLEQTCEVVDDAIIMPNGLQADVVVPIVNFMYTGTLEFELKMYNRLLRTAKDMNMTVLLKLLEAHRRTMEMHPQKSGGGHSTPKPRRRAGPGSNTTTGRSLIQGNQGKRLPVAPSVDNSQNRNIPTSNTTARLHTAGPLPVKQIGSTTFTRIKVENESHEINAPTSTSAGYSLIKQPPQQQQQQPSSPFEQLRKGYNNNKRPAVSTFVSPPAKKPNLEDVKEFAEQQRVRKQIAAEYGDDDYDASNIMDDDTIHNDDDDEEMSASTGQAPMSQTASASVQTNVPSSSQPEDPPGTTTIIVKHEGPDKPPTIVVKDSSNSKMNHAKIISEVLRQYPHLVRANKNIKLKIMPNAVGQSQKLIVKKDAVEPEKPIQLQQPANKLVTVPKITDIQSPTKILASSIISTKPKSVQQQPETSTNIKTNIGGIQASVNKPSTLISTAPVVAAQPQKRRIDSKTMHALIAQGAQNTTGPWLCLRCGRNGHPISIPSYRGFRRHLINTHKEIIDPALCEYCGWRSTSKRELHFHMQIEHKVQTPLYIFPECQLCSQICIDSDGLNQHLIDSHPDENKQQCIYCNKIFPEELQLYTHMKTFHKKQALDDGIIDYSDDESQAQMIFPPLSPGACEKAIEEEMLEQQQEKKIKILSDISLPIASSIIKTESFGPYAAEATSEEYLQEHVQGQVNTETKFVAADGSEMILTAEQRKEILSQLNQEHEGSGIVMVLNENQDQQQRDNTIDEIQSDQGIISHDEMSQTTTATNEREDEQAPEEEDNQIYNEMKSRSDVEDDLISQTETAAKATNETSMNEEEREEQENIENSPEHEQSSHYYEESKESMDNLEWAENLISEHDLADEVLSQTQSENVSINKSEETEMDTKRTDEDKKAQEEINKKLQELTGDWSEDDDDDITEEEESIKETSETENNTIKEKEEISTSVADVEMTAEKDENATAKDELVEQLNKSSELNDNVDLLASLQSEDKDINDKDNNDRDSVDKETAENAEEKDAIDETLKSLNKEDEDNANTALTGTEEKNECEEKERVIDPLKEIVDDLPKESDENIEAESTSKEPSDVIDDNENEIEKKPMQKLETIDQPEASSSAMEFSEETKKDLIDRLLNEQVVDTENTGEETPSAPKLDLESLQDDDNTKNKLNVDEASSVELPQNDDEFLNLTPETKDIVEEDIPKATITPTKLDAAGSSVSTELSETSSKVKDETTLSSEDRVKSLISEWGDDEEDEIVNDTDLPDNL